MEKQAMIMAAGLGSRLGEMTRNCPKALISYKGKALLSHIIENLIQYNYTRIVVNVHHFSDQVIDFIDKLHFPEVTIIISNESEELLDTGGGLKKASQYFESYPVLIHNVDIISDINLTDFYNFHLKNKGIATMAVKNRITSRPLLKNSKDVLCGWRNTETKKEIITRQCEVLYPIAFSGIYIIEKEFIDLLPNENIFPIMPEILELSKEYEIKLFDHSINEWKDMGKIEQYKIV